MKTCIPAAGLTIGLATCGFAARELENFADDPADAEMVGERFGQLRKAVAKTLSATGVIPAVRPGGWTTTLQRERGQSAPSQVR